MTGLHLKLTQAPHLKDNEKELLAAIDDGRGHTVKLTTNKLDIVRDKRDERNIATIKGVKIIYQIASGGCILLLGNLGCSFRPPFGGEFFVKQVIYDKQGDFDANTGYREQLIFSNSPISINDMHLYLDYLTETEDFEFNLSQFDEFMDIFNFYKALSTELNNNVTYSIDSISSPYYFVAVDEKEIEIDESNAIKDSNGILLGYKLEQYKFELLSEEQQRRVQELVDISIKANSKDIEKDIRRIKSFADNLFLSNEPTIIEEVVQQFMKLHVVKVHKQNNSILIMGEYDFNEELKYLHLYDMGQKIKLESINESLRLIKRGGTGGETTELLKYLIGDAPMPVGSASDTSAMQKYIEKLNDAQKKAFLMAVDGSPISLIKGPPGTGKTHVINAIVQYITKELGEKVIISSQTHIAIDNVLDKLMENYDLVIPHRITNRKNRYSEQEIDSTLYETWAKKFDEHNKRATFIPLANTIARDVKNFKGAKKLLYSTTTLFTDYSVIGATTTTSAIAGKKGSERLKGYDWLIIDEVSKCPLPEILRYLPYVKRIIMVGDDFQLAPLLEFTKEEVQDLKSYNEDKFEKLKAMYESSVFAKTLDKAREAGRLVRLNENYRSVKTVLNAYNIFYNNQLVNMRESIQAKKAEFKQYFQEKDVFFIDVKNGKEAKENTSRYNIEELHATATILEDLLKNAIDPVKISVSAIFPYAAQIAKFKREHLELINKAKKVFKSFEMDTVDAFQGKETDIVLVNTVVTDSSQRNFLNDFRRINVAMSRAKDKLFVFGNPHTLSTIDMEILGGNRRRYFKEIIDDIRRFGQIIQYDRGIQYELTSESKIKVV